LLLWIRKTTISFATYFDNFGIGLKDFRPLELFAFFLPLFDGKGRFQGDKLCFAENTWQYFYIEYFKDLKPSNDVVDRFFGNGRKRERNNSIRSSYKLS
jgi:hypothetical protein